MFEIVAEIINCFFETLIMVLFYNRVLERRFRGAAPNVGLFVLFMLINLSRSFIVIKISLNMCLTAVWLFIICAVMHKGSLRKKLIATAVCMGVIVFSNSVVSALVGGVMQQPLNGDYVLTLRNRMFFTVPFWVMIFLLSRLGSVFFNRKYRKLPLKYSIMLFAVPLLCCVGSFSVTQLLTQLFPLSIQNMLMGLFAMACFMLFTVVTFDFIDNYSARVRLAETEEIIRAHDENYRMMRDNEQELRKLRHNILDYMSVITELVKSGNSAETKKYYDRLRQLSEEITARVYTEDAEIDSILNAEHKKAVSAGIRFSVKAKLDEPVRIDVVDKSTLLCNLINNAIEGCRGSADEFVAVSLFSDSDNIKIIVENSAETAHEFRRTSKPDRAMHGYGMGIIREIVEKYNGAFDIRHEGDIVTAAVLMKNRV